MIPENESDTETSEIPLEFPEKVKALPIVEPEIPDTTPGEVIPPITDVKTDGYNESVNNLIAKYTKK